MRAMRKTSRARRGIRLAATSAALAALLAAGAAASPGAPAAEAAQRANIFSLVPSTWLSWEEYERLGAGGVRAIRVPFFWHVLQPDKGAGFHWGTTDHVAAYAAANGIRLQPFVMGVPGWMERPKAYPAVRSAKFRKAWKRLLGALIRRYGPGGYLWRWLGQVAPQVKPHPVKAWQVWNEPNARSYWRPVSRSPELYARLLRFSERVIHARQPGAAVIAAGIFETPTDGITMQRFLRRFYDTARVRDGFDALALHPYARNTAKVMEQLRFARKLMARHGDARKPLRVTEVGWPTKVTNGNGVFTKTELGQRRLLTRTFRAFLRHRERLRLESVTWYTWRDNDLYSTCDLCRFSGLFRRNGSAKPAWGAFVRFTGGSRQAPKAAGAHPPPPIPPPDGG